MIKHACGQAFKAACQGKSPTVAEGSGGSGASAPRSPLIRYDRAARIIASSLILLNSSTVITNRLVWRYWPFMVFLFSTKVIISYSIFSDTRVPLIIYQKTRKKLDNSSTLLVMKKLSLGSSNIWRSLALVFPRWLKDGQKFYL